MLAVGATTDTELFFALTGATQFDGGEAYLEEDESITLMDNGECAVTRVNQRYTDGHTYGCVTGDYTITCINKHSAEDNATRDAYCLMVATLNTLVIGGMCIWGYYEFQAVQATYEPGELLAWYS